MPTINQLINSSKVNTLDTELIISHVLKKPREFVLAHPEMKIERLKDLKIKRLIAERAKGVPFAYLTGHKEFFGLDFEVNKNVLIPRPETEVMVENVIEKIERLTLPTGRQEDNKIILIDIGTGSGCIPIAITKALKHPSALARPPLSAREGSGVSNVIAIDISSKALAVAKKNARKHKVKIKFLRGDLLSPILKSSIFNLKSSIIITANLPYLTNKQISSEPSIKYEPKQALAAGKDGLKYYRQFFKQLSPLYKLYDFTNFIAFIEINPEQSKSIKCLIKKYFPQLALSDSGSTLLTTLNPSKSRRELKINFIKDLAGKNRVVEITYN